MASVKVTTAAGKSKGNVDLDEAFFDVEPNIPVMHQVVTAQLAARRAGTQSTKTRAEVRAAAPSRGARRAPAGPARLDPPRTGGVAASPRPQAPQL